MGARFVFGAVVVVASCAQILDLDDYQDVPMATSSATGSSSAGGAGATGGTAGAPAGVVWAQRWGGAEQQRLSDFAVDDDDAVVLTGNHEGVFDFSGHLLTNNGASDFFVAKVDATGAPMWASAWGDDKPQYALAIGRKRVTEELTYVTGRFGGTFAFPNAPLMAGADDDLDGFVVRFSELGVPNSAFLFPGQGVEQAAPIAVAPIQNQNLLITGHASENMGIANSTVTTVNEKRGFLARIYGGGEADWLLQFGQAGNQTPFGVAGDGEGHSVVVGSFADSIDVGFAATALGGDDAFVARFLTGTGVAWLAHFGSTGTEHAERVAIMKDGDVLVMGSFSGDLRVGAPLVATGGDPDLWLARLAESDGSVVWALSLEASGVAIPRALTIDYETDRAWLGGDFVGQVTLGDDTLDSVVGTDIFVAAFDPESGQVLGGWRYGEPAGANEGGIQSLAGLQVRSDSSLVMGGSFEGDIDLGGATLTSAGENDVFIAVLVP